MKEKSLFIRQLKGFCLFREQLWERCGRTPDTEEQDSVPDTGILS